MQYRLEEVTTKKQKSQFIALPKTLYKDYPCWVCPLDNDIKSRFDPKKNELFEGGDAVRFLVYDSDNKPVGRIAAFYNMPHAKSLVKEGYPLTGGCGFFESIDSLDVAT